jgi:hypothetical protein
MNDPSVQKPDQNVSTGDAASSKLVAGGSRRRFIKGGAAAAPVILTFTSRPVLGFDYMCLTPSRMISGNHSGFHGPESCGGTSLSTYQTQAADTGKPADWYGTPFTQVFGTTNPYESTTTPKVQDKLGAVFLDSFAKKDATATNSTAQFAAYLIAAYLNADKNVGSVATVLTTDQVVHMWNDVIGTGSYCPQLTMCWSATQVIAYLQYSGIVPPT